MKKCLAILMTLIFCISMFTGMSVNAFSDVTEDHRHYQAINYLAGKGVINGYEDGTFKPEDTITRAEFVKMLLEFLGFGNIYGDSIVKTNFTDVDGKEMTITSKDEDGKETTTTTMTNQHWAAGYIKLAVDKGVVNGYGDGTFGPDDPVKYEEAIKMIVCCLGREEHAKTRAESVKIPLWPDGYLSIGNDLMVGKNTDYELGANASRSNVAQMLYNVKDVQIYVAPTISVGGMTGSVGGGSIGGGSVGGGSVGSSVGSSTTVVTDLVAYGQVVAAVKDPEDTRKQIVIDDNIVIDGELVSEVHRKDIVLKLETPIEENDYERFYTNGTDYSSFIGQRVELKYSYNPDAGRYEIDSIGKKETEEIYIDAKNFRREKTDRKNAEETNIHICYTKEDNDVYQSLYTDDLNELTVIYNNKVIDVEAMRDEYLENNPSYEGEREDIDIITLTDLMPEVGNIKIINAYEDNTIDAVWVNTYETFVVGERSFTTTPKNITDKYRTDGETTEPLKLVINENETVNIKKNGREIPVTSIQVGDILTVVKSKCATVMDITVEGKTTVSGILQSTKTENGVKKSFTLKTGKTYTLSDYYLDYVDKTLEYENGDDQLVLTLNSKNEVIWASVTVVPYSKGYLISATYSESKEELTLEILTDTGSITKYKLHDTKWKYITMATDCLDSVELNNMPNADGWVYNKLDAQLILASLQENAATINEGKPAEMVVNAGTAQPIMYTLSEGAVNTLVTFEPDTVNKFTGESLKYTLVNRNHKFSNADNSKTFTAETDALVVFVPNNRTGWEANGYKIGRFSALSSKLIAYMNYNIEPYYSADSDGRGRNMFVVYNQNIDATPNYRSDNMIVTSVDPVLINGVEKYQIKGYVGTTSTINKTYTAESTIYTDRAYVLDENFERIPDERREVEAGDVIRVGFSPTGLVACVEIVLDVSAEFKEQAPKHTAVSKYSSSLTPSSDGFYDNVYYFARIGEITSIDSSDIQNFCNIELDDPELAQVYIGDGYSRQPIVMYDHTETNSNNRIKTKDPATGETLTMSDVFEGDMLYVWQSNGGTFKQIYAVRYPVAAEPAAE